MSIYSTLIDITYTVSVMGGCLPLMVDQGHYQYRIKSTTAVSSFAVVTIKHHQNK